MRHICCTRREAQQLQTQKAQLLDTIDSWLIYATQLLQRQINGKWTTKKTKWTAKAQINKIKHMCLLHHTHRYKFIPFEFVKKHFRSICWHTDFKNVNAILFLVKMFFSATRTSKKAKKPNMLL
jgi:hypothetical protein